MAAKGSGSKYGGTSKGGGMKSCGSMKTPSNLGKAIGGKR